MSTTTLEPPTQDAPTSGAATDTTRPPRARNRLMLWIVIGLLAAAGVTYYSLFVKTYHLATVAPGVLYRDGNEHMRQFKQTLKRVQPKTVVCLVDEREMAAAETKQFAEEAEHLKSAGIKFEHIPVKLGGWPTTGDVTRFLDVVNKPENQPVLVHCAQGVRRTGMFVAAYQMSVQNYDKDKAKAELLTFGHSDRTVGDIKKFIDHYDPQARAVNLPEKMRNRVAKE